MGLRVFESPNGKLFLEITAPELQLQTALFVPALPEGHAEIHEADRLSYVAVPMLGKRYFVPYLLITVRNKDERSWRLVGELEQNDSINILNHIIDVLAYPTPNRG
jgi:hypothetical protein